MVTYTEAFATRYNFVFILNCLIRVHDDVIVIGIKIVIMYCGVTPTELFHHMITILYARNTVVMQLCTRKCSVAVFWLHTSTHTQARSTSLHVHFWQLYGRILLSEKCDAWVLGSCVEHLCGSIFL